MTTIHAIALLTAGIVCFALSSLYFYSLWQLAIGNVRAVMKDREHWKRKAIKWQAESGHYQKEFGRVNRENGFLVNKEKDWRRRAEEAIMANKLLIDKYTPKK